MILVYHEIAFKSKNENTVDIFHFFLQMFSIFLSKKQVVNLKNYSNKENQIVLAFDDGYKSVKKHALWILKLFQYPFEIFLVDEFVKLGNNGDKNFLSSSELKKMVNNRVCLQYHSKSHKNLWEIDDEKELFDEINIPDDIKALDEAGFEYFAYPCWRYSEKVYNLIKKFYKGARSGKTFADGTIYALNSIKVLNKTNIGEIING